MPAVCGPFRNADRAAFEVRGGLDPAVGAHVDRGMSVHPRRKHRDRDHRGVALRGQRNVFAERQLGDVPFERLGEPEGDLLDRGEDERRERDAVRAHQALRDLAHVLVVADREREMHRGGAVAADDLRRARVRRGRLGFCRCHLFRFPLRGVSISIARILYADPRYVGSRGLSRLRLDHRKRQRRSAPSPLVGEGWGRGVGVV